MAAFETPPLGEYPVIPPLREGAMAHSKPFVAKPNHQKPLGFPGELVPEWEKVAVTKLGELVAESRADRKSTRLNSSHIQKSRMPSSA